MESSRPQPAPAEPRQRWRLEYRRRTDAPALAQRDQLAAWEAALIASGIPFAGLDLPVPKIRLAFAAPLASDTAGEHELADLFVVERQPVSDVRARLAEHLPAGHELVDLHDVWLGEPPLAGQVVAADYRVSVATDDGSPLEPERLAAAAGRLLAAANLPRTRDKGGRMVPYDLRPLLLNLEIRSDQPAIEPATPRTSVVARIHVRFAPELGVGRPEEVLAALSEAIGTPLVALESVRERLYLAGDVPARG